MDDGHLRSAVERLETALARVETALGKSAAHAGRRAQAQAAALKALEQRHLALRQVMTDSVRELDMLLVAAGERRNPETPSEPDT